MVARLLATSRNRVTIPDGVVFREQTKVLLPFQNDIIENFWTDRIFAGCLVLNRFGLLIVHSRARLLRRTDKIIVMTDQHLKTTEILYDVDIGKANAMFLLIGGVTWSTKRRSAAFKTRQTSRSPSSSGA